MKCIEDLKPKERVVKIKSIYVSNFGYINVCS